jgi:hypothetical protein
MRSMILVWSALLSSSVLWRTLRWELIADMILHNETNKILPKRFLLDHKNRQRLSQL